MKRLYILVSRTFLILSLGLISVNCFAEYTIKVAVLDNFIKLRTAEYISNEYYNNYTKGLMLAKNQAKKLRINIEYGVFLYDDKPLDIFSKINEINNFSPNVIIGPRGSNDFLMLRNIFKNILVLSPYATADDIKKLPRNFQSLTLPNALTAWASAKIFSKMYPAKNVFAVVERDCKDCVNFTAKFISDLHRLDSTKQTKQVNFLSNEVNFFKINTILKKYDPKTDIFLIPNNSNTTFTLIYRILTALKAPAVFVGGSNWGTYVSQELSQNSRIGRYYTGIQIVPWSVYDKNSQFQAFRRLYIQTYHSEKISPITYLSYQSMMSAIDASTRFPILRNTDLTAVYLQSYLKALKKYPFWYKSTHYAVIAYMPQNKCNYKGSFDVVKDKYVASTGRILCK